MTFVDLDVKEPDMEHPEKFFFFSFVGMFGYDFK